MMKSISLLVLSIVLQCLLTAEGNNSPSKSVDGSVAATSAGDSKTVAPPGRKIQQVPFLVSVNGRKGFIDSAGKVVIAPRFQNAYRFSDGLAAVQIDGRWGFIDLAGRQVIRPKFKSVALFSDGLTSVQENSYSDQWKYIDKTGKIVIDSGFDDAKPFRNGVAKVGLQTSGSKLTSLIADVGIECDYHYIDKTGRTVPTPARTHNGEAGELIAFAEGDLLGFVDANDQVVIKPQFESVGPFSEGLAKAWQRNHYGFIDRTGKFVIPPRYQYANDFSEGLAGVSFGKEGWGFIDKTGTVVVKPKFSWISSGFRDGIAEVTFDRKNGYVSKDGTWVWKPPN